MINVVGRYVFKEYVFKMPRTKKLRGIVQIDESLLVRKIKHNRGHKMYNKKMDYGCT